MELSLARELPSCELSTISTAASRSRQREESLPRIHAAMSGRGVPGRKAQSPRDSGAEGGRTRHRASRRGRGGSQTPFPSPSWLRGPAPCELSPTPQTRSSRHPGRTHFTTRAGSSAVTASNPRRPAFSPGRRDPRCHETQPRGRTARLPLPSPRTSAAPPGSPRSSARMAQKVHTSPFCVGLRCCSPLFFSSLFSPTGVLLFSVRGAPPGGQAPLPDRAPEVPGPPTSRSARAQVPGASPPVHTRQPGSQGRRREALERWVPRAPAPRFCAPAAAAPFAFYSFT